jgi:LmbE family N-acetylglucosaminyl deacetylase
MDSEHDGYITSNWDSAVAQTSNYQFVNNVIYSNGTKGWSDKFKGTVNSNAYGGSNTSIMREDDTAAILVTEEDFCALGTGTSAIYQNNAISFGSVEGYRISEKSACIDAGAAIVDNGGRDYFGNTVGEAVKPNIGEDNQYNGNKLAENGNDQIILNFEDCSSETLAGVYQNCDFGNRGWNISSVDGNNKLWSTSYTTDSQVSKIAIPDQFVLSSFQAYCDEGNAIIKIEAGDESKTFSITSYEKVYLTEFEQAAAGVYIVYENGCSPETIKFDNIVLRRVQSNISSTNVTRGKTATASSYERNPSNAVDGDETTLWVADGYTELSGAWWMVDMGDTYCLSNYEIVFEKDETVAWKYKIEGSPDNSHWDLIWDNTNNQDGSKTQTGTIPDEYADTAYRYLKVTITGLPSTTAWPAIAEFNAYKKVPFVNVSYNKTTSASTVEGWWHDSSNGNDGDESSLWVADGYTELSGAWWSVDLGAKYQIAMLEIVFENELDNAWKFKVEASSDNNNWSTIWDKTSNIDTSKKQNISIANSTDMYQYLRVTITGLPNNDVWPAFAEFNAYVLDDDESDTSDEIVLTEEGQYIDLDLAFGQSVTVSSGDNKAYTDNITDRKLSTTWKPDSDDICPFAQVNLDREYNIENCKVEFLHGEQAYTVEVKINGVWELAANVDESCASDTIYFDKRLVEAIRFNFTNPSQELEIADISFEGVDAMLSHGKSILVMAPHEDDEMLMAGGVMKRAIDAGEEVNVVIATNGDYSGGTAKGETRIADTVQALESIGVSKDHIFFMGYADTAGLGVGAYTTAFTNSFLYKLYVADDETVLSSAQGNTQTYGNANVKQDYHYTITGEHAEYTRTNFVNDLQSLIESCNPTDIYVTSRYDMHFDHAYFGLFATEVIQNIQKTDKDFNPTMHEAIIHTHLTDEVYPSDSGMFGYGHEDETTLTSWYYPEGLEDKTILNWGERENILVPYSMRQTPYKYNLKNIALQKYSTEYYSWIASFAKVNEVFWKHDFSSIAHLATVTASSELSSDDRSVDQSAIKAVDGIADGYATGLADNHSRFAHAEWVTDNEGKGAWINLSFDTEKEVKKIVLYDRPNTDDQILSAHIEMDNGLTISIGELPNDGRPLEIEVDNISTRNIKLVVDSVSSTTTSVGLAEIEVYE